jgi:YD repeat-containing protein
MSQLSWKTVTDSNSGKNRRDHLRKALAGLGLGGALAASSIPAVAGIYCPSDAGIWDVFTNGIWTSSYTISCERTLDAGEGRTGGGRGRDSGRGGDRGTGDLLDPNQSGSNGDTNQKIAATCPMVANPVVIATGNKIEPEPDFGTGGEMALHLNRTWNQYWDGIGLFGWKWLSNFDYRLSFGTASAYGPVGTCYARPSIAECASTASFSDIWAHRPDGRKIHFIKNATDGVYYEDKPSPISRIVRQGDGTFLLTFEDNLSEQYTKGGYPQWVQDEHGLRWAFTYGGLNNTQVQRITHTNGRYVQFTWVDDELRGVADPAGSAYTFTYTAQKVEPGIHLLKTTTRPGAPTTVITYHYTGEAGEPTAGLYALTGKSFNGARYSWFTYDTSNRVASSEHAGGVERYTFAYTPGANGAMTVLETNPLGKQATYDFLNNKLIGVTGHSSAHCPVTGSDNTYDANGYLDKATDNNGNITDYDYSSAGRLLQKIEGYGTSVARKTIYGWDISKNRLTSVTVVGLNQTSYTYTSDDRIASVAVKNLSANGVFSQTLTTTYSYTKHPSGLLASVTTDGPLPGTGDAIVLTYDTYGNLTSTQNSLGHSTTYSNYNALGQPGRVTGPNGDMTDILYDARGRPTAVKRWVNGAWQTTTYAYDAMGRPASEQRPDGQIRNFEYDAAWRLIREYEQESVGVYAQKRYTYNNLSKVTRIDTERTTTPASAPALSAPGTSANGTYTVSWTAVADTATYQLEESVNGGAWTNVFNGAVTNRGISGKPNGTYSYRVTACNSAGCGPYSATSSVVVSLSGPPVAPTLTSPPSDVGSTYQVAWTSSVGATSYRLEESRNGGAWTQIYNAAATSTWLTKNMSATFRYQVRACNSYGCSAYSGIRDVAVDASGGL